MTGRPDNHLTRGSVLRGLYRLSWPMLASSLLQNVQSLIDQYWVGSLGTDAVAAVGVGGTVLALLLPVFIGTATGTVALVSRAVGAGRHEEAGTVAGNSISLAIFAGLVTGVMGYLASHWLCVMLGVEPAVVEKGRAYLEVSFLGSFTIFVLFTANSALQGAGNAMLPMCAMILSNILNMALDPIFIFGWFGLPPMGVTGAAVATVLSQLLASFLVVGGLIRGVHGIRIRPTDWSIRADLTRRLLKVGVPSSGQMLSRSIMQLVLMYVVGLCGTVALAAYAIAMRFHMLMIMPAFAIGNAAATMVGQNLGAGQPDRAARAAWTAVAAVVGISVVSSAFMLAFARPIMAAFTDSPAVVAIGIDYLWIVSPFLTFAGIAIVLGRAHQGAGDTTPPLVATLVALWLLQVPLAVYLPRFMTTPTHGIWWAVVSALVCHGLMLIVWFRLGHWKRKEV